ncbi:hypothetical protein GCM10009118_05990 [Wandonia haliotis]|uniref:Outer membrane protein beta-barrel domain-containing protein n=2 Tax=Wandonia haliotis TaxID=574963 RepID=A0ABN1MLN9_9FLAO
MGKKVQKTMNYRLIIFVSFICLFFTKNSFSQADTIKKQDTQSRYNPGLLWRFTGFEPRYGKEGEKYDRLVVDICYNDWLGDKNGTKTQWYSIGYNINLLFDVPFNKQSTASMGIGLSFSHVNLMNNGVLRSNDSLETTTLTPHFAGETPRKMNKFVANYIEIPVEFRFRSPGYQHFKFHLGFKAGVRISSFERWKEGSKKFKEFNHPDIARFRYGITARIGIRNWALFGSFFISDLFTNSQSSQLLPYSFGISLSLF